MSLRNNIVSTLALFGSLGTLVCCALPFLFVTLGAGAVLAGLVSAVPQIVWLSEHKVALFIFAGLMLLLSGVLRYISRNAPCPADPAQAKACMRARRFSSVVFYASLTIYCTGFFFAFVTVHIFS
ncbi:MAG TPA: hypothetical protein DEA55_01635 [Rhodospirillaceae bacterium]|nr:hypothetical protein [Rhodospirillaceae bacterium]